jgi:hypothetical protein
MPQANWVDLALIETSRKRDISGFLGRDWPLVAQGAITTRKRHVCLYRLESERVHLVRAKQETALFSALAAALPLVTAHEGVWRVTTYDEHFTITSRDAITVGPFSWIKEVQSKMDVFGLELRPVANRLHGFSHFEMLSAGCIVDAVDRLYWLEDRCWRINNAIAKYTGEMWAKGIDETMEHVPTLDDPDDLVNPLPLCPDLPPRQIWKNFA